MFSAVDAVATQFINLMSFTPHPVNNRPGGFNGDCKFITIPCAGTKDIMGI